MSLISEKYYKAPEKISCYEVLLHASFFFFSIGVLQLMLQEAPQPYGLLYYPRIGHFNTAGA
jgi:hypothetical protein